MTSTTFYHLIINDGDICGPVTSNTIEIEITDEFEVSIQISVNNNPICEGEDAIFNVSPTNPGNDPIYYWHKNNIIVDSTLIPSYTYSNLEDGDMVICKLKSSYQCAVNNPASSDSILMTVKPSPVIDSIVVKHDKSGNPIVLICALSSDSLNYSYQWYKDNTERENDTLQFLYEEGGLASGFYKVEVKNKFKCSISAEKTILPYKTNIFNPSDIFVVYPNPTQGRFTISLNENIIPEDFESCSVKIVDITGKTVLKNEICNVEQSINLFNIDKGLYFIEVLISGAQRQTKKIIFN